MMKLGGEEDSTTKAERLIWIWILILVLFLMILAPLSFSASICKMRVIIQNLKDVPEH